MIFFSHSFCPHGPAKAAVNRLECASHAAPPTTIGSAGFSDDSLLLNTIAASSTWLIPRRLVSICLAQLVRLLVCFEIGSQASAIQPHLFSTSNDESGDQIHHSACLDGRSTELAEIWAAHTLTRTLWPEHLGSALIEELCRQHRFTGRTARLVKNCVTNLSLDAYSLMTNDLLLCLVNRWNELRKLSLRNLQSAQLSAENLAQLSCDY
ncbi:unnamed protein product [Protopolystoma xenopodis]|uniref:Uncharacterized protein n=1 Tax=Protopolystoma xenopodis TaxID=117903 RepID=A0A3S5FG83_9PLAT|nr:unnamed protein product [Protopolystoma xenopodis]